MRKGLIQCVLAFVILALATPLWARTESARLTLNQPATIGQTTLHPGRYRFVANTMTQSVRVMRNGRTMATIPGKWVTLHQKSPYTAVLLQKRVIQEIQFSGRTKAIKLD